MKVLCLDYGSNMLDFALRCMAEGHEVRTYQSLDKERNKSRVGNGLIDKVDDWRPSMLWADIIVLGDNAHWMNEIEPWRNRGFPIFGPNIATANWELERGTGQKVFADNGIEVIPSVQFTDYDKAIEFVKKTKGRYVSKPSGDVDKSLSYVSKGPDDMLHMLGHWKKKGKNKSPFILQEFRAGIEMAVGGYFGKNGFSKYFLENFEHKKLMVGDVGVNTGEMFTIIKYVEDSLLAEKLLKPLEGELFRQGYTGFIDIAVMIDKKGNLNPMEFTTRPGYPLSQIQNALHPDPVEWKLDLINGKDTFEPDTRIATGIVVAMPPFPYQEFKIDDLCGFPVWGITEKNRYNIHPCEMMAGEGPVNGKLEPMMVSCGTYTMVVSGVANTVEKSAEKPYKIIDQLIFPNSAMYRTDAGCRVIKQLPELQALGFAEEWVA
jgi:phosphoribosylamine--glycine ligase